MQLKTPVKAVKPQHVSRYIHTACCIEYLGFSGHCLLRAVFTWRGSIYFAERGMTNRAKRFVAPEIDRFFAYKRIICLSKESLELHIKKFYHTELQRRSFEKY